MFHISTIYNQILHPEINSGHQFERLEKPFRRPIEWINDTMGHQEGDRACFAT